MEEKILKKAALAVMAVAIAACVLVPALPQILRAADALAAAMEDEQTREEKKKRKMSVIELLEYNNQHAEGSTGQEDLPENGIRLKLPLGVTGDDLNVTQDYLAQTITVSIPYAGESYLYEYPMQGCSEIMENIEFKIQQKYGILEFKTDQVYELETSWNEDHFDLQFLTPHEVYDKVIVVDAGHGDEDTGTVKQGICEKDIDLDIVLKLKELFDASEEGSVGVYYTRTADVNPDLQIRAELAEKTDADLFISVHNSETKSGMMSSIHGTQSVYNASGDGSQKLAQICQSEITAMLGSSDKGLRADDGTEVIAGCKMPAVLVEVGFMTNQTELADLCSQEYQKKAAQGIYQAVMRALEEGY